MHIRGIRIGRWFANRPGVPSGVKVDAKQPLLPVLRARTDEFSSSCASVTRGRPGD